MTEAEFYGHLSNCLRPRSPSTEIGEDYTDPSLEVLRYEVRRVRLHWLPILGRALSVVAIVRQPADLTDDAAGTRRLLDRVARAVHGRYPPWPSGSPGLVVGLTVVVLTGTPIAPEDERALALAMPEDRRSRVVTLGLIRVNLEQEALAFAIGPAPRDLFPEPLLIAEGLSEVLGRFVPPFDPE